MEMNLQEERTRAVVIERAGEWYARNRTEVLTEVEARDFLAWLQASPAHVREYLAVAELAASMPALLDSMSLDRTQLTERAKHWLRNNDNVVALRPLWENTSPPARKPTVRAARPSGRLTSFAASILVAVGGLGTILYWQLSEPGLSGLPRSVETSKTSPQRTVRLRDGSVMYLDANTRVEVRFSGNQRLIELDRGQALFKVAHNATRPFVVRAASTDVVAVGTRFEVSRADAEYRVTVTVVEGRVDVISGSSPATPELPSAVQSAGSHPVSLREGEQVQLSAATVNPSVRTVDVHSATAWLHHELVFDERPLEEVAAEFSRYGTPVKIEDPQLRHFHVSGAFDAYDTDSFLDYLRRIGRVEQTDAGVRVLSNPPSQ